MCLNNFNLLGVYETSTFSGLESSGLIGMSPKTHDTR